MTATSAARFTMGGHAVAAVRLWLPLREVVINRDGKGATRYARHFGCGEVEAWAVDGLSPAPRPRSTPTATLRSGATGGPSRRPSQRSVWAGPTATSTASAARRGRWCRGSVRPSEWSPTPCCNDGALTGDQGAALIGAAVPFSRSWRDPQVRYLTHPAKRTGNDGHSLKAVSEARGGPPAFGGHGRETSPAPVSGAARVGLYGAHPFGTAVPTTQVLLAPVFLSPARDSGTRGER